MGRRMRSRQKISLGGIALIEAFEGLRRKAARLPDGRWTIGYGHTLYAREGAEVSEKDAEDLLRYDLRPVVEAVNDAVRAPLTQNQFDALCAFAFNIGVEPFRQSDALALVNESRLTEAALAIEGWRRADLAGEDVVIDALIRRRAAEKALFLTPDGGAFTPTPSALVRPRLDLDAAEALPGEPPAEIEAPLTGDVAEVRRVPEPEPQQLASSVEITPEPEPAPEPQPAPEPVFERERLPREAVVFSITPAPADGPSLPDQTEVAPPETVTLATSEAESAATAPQTAEAVAAEVTSEAPVESQAELASENREASEPGAEALAASTLAAMAFFAPPEPEPASPPDLQGVPEPQAQPQPEPELPPAPEPAPAPAAKVLRESFSGSRLYGPMAAAALGAAKASAQPPAPLAEPTAAPAPQQPLPVEPVSAFGPPAPPSSRTAAAVTPGEALHVDTRPPPAELVLTPPPEYFDRPDSPGPSEPAAPEPALADEAGEAPLFDQAWGGGANGRIVRHEAPAEEPAVEKRGNGLLVLTAVVGFAAFMGAIAAFLRGRAGGADDITTYAWVLALIGVGCVATSVYFLLKRLGGVAE